MTKNNYYKDKNVTLINGDSFLELDKIKDKSVDVVFADPPYFLSSGGITCKSGKMKKNNKGCWDLPKTISKKIEFNKKWISKCRRILKDDGTIWISGTFHNIYAVGVALELEGFSIINNITWQKPNPPPNLACRCFTNSTETIIWARKILNNSKAKHYFNYKLMKELNGGKQEKDVWKINLPSISEKKFGKHPTQKPVELLEKIIMCSSKSNDTILDCFNGSGTTCVAATKLKRKYIGIELNLKYLKITLKRYKEVISNGK